VAWRGVEKQSLIDDKLQTVKNLYDESSRLWGSISGGYFDFKRRYRDAEKIKTFTKADLLEFYETYVRLVSPFSLLVFPSRFR
jgi:insulysin